MTYITFLLADLSSACYVYKLVGIFKNVTNIKVEFFWHFIFLFITSNREVIFSALSVCWIQIKIWI